MIVAIMTFTVLGVVHFPQSQSTVSATASAYPAFNQISMISTDSVDPSASVNVAASYYTLASESNTQYTFQVPLCDNGSFSSIAAFSSDIAWTKSSSTVAIWTQDFASPSIAPYYFGMFKNEVNVELDQASFVIGNAIISDSIVTYIGTVYANITTPDGSVYSWSHTFNDCVSTTDVKAFAYIDPQWTVYGGGFTTQVGGWSVEFTDVLPSGYSWYTVPSGMTSDTGSQTNSISTSGTGSNTAIDGVIGFHYESDTCTFNIPANEASYDLVFGSPQISQISAEYCGSSVVLDSSATSTTGLLSGSFAIRAVTGSVSGDPNPGGSGSVASDLSSVSYDITLENQQQAVLSTNNAYFTDTVSYSIANPSSNEFTYNIPFSYSTPSGAYYGPYEVSTNSLTTTNGLFTSTLTVSGLEQPYYSCPQAGFQWNYNNGSYTTQSSASSHSVSLQNSYSSSQTIDNYISTISLANTAPTYVSSHLEFLGTGSEMELCFNISQPVFTGELESVTINWGDGVTSNSFGSTYSLTFTHSYTKTGTYTITASFENSPSALDGILSSMSGPTQVYTWQVSITPIITPVYGSQLTVGEPVTMHFTALHDIVGTVTAYDSGSEFQTHTFNSASGSLTMYPPSEGLTGFALAITFDGAFYSITYQYSSPLYPSYNSTFVVEIGGDSLTQQYPITLTNSGSTATGNIIYNFTESNSYWSPYANPLLSNLLFRYANGSLIQSELVTHSSTSATWSLSLYSVPASSSVNILQIFYPTGEGVFVNASLAASSSVLSQSIGTHENSTIVNSTNISYVPYSSVGIYYPNPLLQAFTYFIPDYFNERYMQINWNASWISSEYSPSYTAKVYYYNSETLFSNVTNVGEVSVVYNQPSTQLGQSVFVTASFYSDGLPIQSEYTSQFYIGVKYVQFEQTTVNYVNETSMFFDLPIFGANATFTVYDAWGQPVGIASDLVITSGTVNVAINLFVTQIGIRVINTTVTTLMISANGIYQNVSTFQNFYFLNGSSLTWYANVFDLSLGQNVNYSGTFHTKGYAQTLYVNVTAPLATLVVTGEAYVSSYIGPLSSSPPDNATLLLNGVAYQFGQAAAFFVGTSVNIKILDVTGDILANETVTLEATQNFQNIIISKPSYVLSFVNKEQAKPGSALATEIINLTNTQTGKSYIFSDMVGDTVSLYLTQSTYHLYLHDNATFNTTLNLTSNQNYVIFGQQLVTVQQFNSLMNRTYANTNHFQILPKNFQQIVTTNTFESFDFYMYCANGTPMPPSLLVQFVENSETTMQNSQISVPVSATEQSSTLITNFTTPKVPGSFTLFIEGYVPSVNASGKFSSIINVEATINTSNGLQLTIVAPNSGHIQAGVNTNFSLFAYNGTGALLNASTTLRLVSDHYIVVNLYEGKTFLQILPLQVVADGTYLFSINATKVGNYTVVAEVSSVKIGKTNVSASTFVSITAVSYNPLQQPLSSTSFYSSITIFADYAGIIGFVGVVVYGIYKFFRKRHRKKVDIETGMVKEINGAAMYDHMTPEQKNQAWANIPVSVREYVLNHVLYPVAYSEGYEYIESNKELKKIMDERDKGVNGKK